MLQWTNISKVGRAAGPALVLALALPSLVWAQESETEAPAEAPGIEDELSLGEPANGGGLNQPYTKETVGDWDLRCIRAEDPATEPCQLYQLLADDGGQPIAEFSLFRLPEGGRAEAGATVVVPLETSLQEQLTIQVDGGQARRYPFSFCNNIGCYARIGLTGEDVASFKRGNNARVSIVPVLAPDQRVEVNMSLTGFTAAFDKASILEQ